MNKTIITAELNSITPLLDGLKAVEQEKNSLQHQSALSIISSVDASIELEKVRKKENEIKKQLVNKVHTKDNGTLRSIKQYKDATPSYPSGYWYTKLKGGKLVKAKTQEALYCRLFEIYYGHEALTVERVFELALQDKKETENPKENTLAKYKIDFNRFISLGLREKLVSEITESDLKRYTQELVNSSAQKTKKQYNAYKGVLNLIFRYAIREHMIERNPVEAIVNSNYLKSCNCSEKRTRERIFSAEEIESLEKEVFHRMTLKKYGDYYVYGNAMLIAIRTGMRVGELCALQWADISFKEEQIHIHRQQLEKRVNGEHEYYHVNYTKNEKGISNDGRYFPLTDELTTLLHEIQQKQKQNNICSDYVFANEDGTALKTKAYESFLSRICKHLGIDAKGNHAFRRTLNSTMLANGIDVAIRSKLLGHSIETNLKYYSYPDMDYLDIARSTLNNAIGNCRELFKSIPFDKEKAHNPQIVRLSQQNKECGGRDLNPHGLAATRSLV